MTMLAPPTLTRNRVETMRAAVVYAPGQVTIIKTPVPTPASNEVLIQVNYCGVCSSNLARWEGRTWFNYPSEPGEMGHEGIGRIAALGNTVSGWKIGDHVAFLSNHAYADFDIAKSNEIFALPDDINGMIFLGEPFACAYNIFRRSKIRQNHTVAIVGVGFLGALLIQLASHTGANVIAIAHRPYAQEVAHQAGASYVIGFENISDIINRVAQITQGRLCDIVIEATGKQTPLDIATQITREHGRLIIAGYHQCKWRKVDMQTWNWRGIDVINAHERESAVYIAGMHFALAALREGILNASQLITHYLPLEQLGDAFNLTKVRPPGFMKAVITL